MKYGWIVYPKSTINNSFGNDAFNWMKETAGKYDIHLDILFNDDIIIENSESVVFKSNGRVLKRPDFVLLRDYDFVLSNQLELLGIKVINKFSAMMKTRNKAVTSQILRINGIETPRFLSSQKNDYNSISIFFDKSKFVMKALEGSKGDSVYLINNIDEFNNAYDQTNGKFVCQEFIDSSYGRDVRVYVLGNKVVGAVMRISDSGFKSNFALGGRVENYEIDEAIKKIAIKTASVMNLEFCGIDLLLLKDGYTVCEVNGNAGFRTITSVSSVDMPDEIFKYINATIF